MLQEHLSHYYLWIIKVGDCKKTTTLDWKIKTSIFWWHSEESEDYWSHLKSCIAVPDVSICQHCHPWRHSCSVTKLHKCCYKMPAYSLTRETHMNQAYWADWLNNCVYTPPQASEGLCLLRFKISFQQFYIIT